MVAINGQRQAGLDAEAAARLARELRAKSAAEGRA
jgi:hypothetical protein